jgi:hypothetical protein
MKIRDRAPWALTVVLFWVALIACGDQAGAGAPSGSPTTHDRQASERPDKTETPDDRQDQEDNHASDGGKKNVVEILNKTPGRVRMRSSVQLNRIRGDVVTPLNAAVAVGQDCTGCQTIAVALQLNLYVQGAHNVSPENYSIALNVRCSHCVTIAHAIQFALPVTDPEDDNNDGPDSKEAKKLLQRMQKELDAIAKDRNVTVDQAEQRVEAVLAEFRSLANSMREDLKRTDAEDSPSPSPSRSPDRNATPTPTPAGSAPASPAATPTATPSPTP